MKGFHVVDDDEFLELVGMLPWFFTHHMDELFPASLRMLGAICHSCSTSLIPGSSAYVPHRAGLLSCLRYPAPLGVGGAAIDCLFITPRGGVPACEACKRVPAIFCIYRRLSLKKNLKSTHHDLVVIAIVELLGSKNDNRVLPLLDFARKTRNGLNGSNNMELTN